MINILKNYRNTKFFDYELTIRGLLYYNFFLTKSQYWSQDKIKKFQVNKLKKLLIICGNEIPYYKDLFKTLHFNPQYDFNNLEDLHKIPILTKEDARNNRDKLINPNYVDKSLILKTSGSTGNPFETLVSYNAWVVEQAVIWRHWFWGGYKFRDKMAIVRSYTPKTNEPLIKFDSTRNFNFYSPFHLTNDNIQYYVDHMIKENTKILRGYPSSIQILAHYFKEKNINIPNLKLILTASESLTKNNRDFIEDVFKVKISNHYGLAEVCVMMGDCGKHNGLHNYDEYGYLELLNTDTSKIKKIVGTNLHNYALPLIRYETGDFAEVDDNICGCNKGLNRVLNIVGRESNFISCKNDVKIPITNFYTMFEHFNEIIQWQIIQKNNYSLQIHIDSKHFASDRIEYLKEELSNRLPEYFEINLEFNNNFHRSIEGKQNPFVKLIK